MMEFEPNDYDLIQANEENLELIEKKLVVDIFEYFGIEKIH